MFNFKQFLYLALILVVLLSTVSCSKNSHKTNSQLATTDRIIPLQSSISLSNYNADLYIVNFWATWCPPCRTEIPHFISITNQYPNRVQVIGISLDNASSVVESFITDHQINYPVTMKSGFDTSQFDQLSALPTTFILDKNYAVLKKLVGYVSETQLQTIINTYL